MRVLVFTLMASMALLGSCSEDGTEGKSSGNGGSTATGAGGSTQRGGSGSGTTGDGGSTGGGEGGSTGSSNGGSTTPPPGGTGGNAAPASAFRRDAG